MKLNPQEKNKLTDAAKSVYLAYTGLDFFKSRTFTTKVGSQSLHDLCKQAILDKNYSQTILINGIHYQLILTSSADNEYKVQFSRLVKKQADAPLMRINDYSDLDALALLTKQQFTISINDKAELTVANRINEQQQIGGPGKIDLYRTHLVTLYHIIEKIESEEDNTGLLVALATGSGKTYVQALWMLVLSISGINGVFALPDKLVSQFAKDLRQLLPESFVNSMVLLRSGNEANSAADQALHSLRNPETSGQIILGSSEELLDKYYPQLQEADSDRTFLSFDEQHLIMKAERRRMRLIELSKQKLAMFLTATPNPETYRLSGNKPVAIMSSGQKKEAGQGLFPRLTSFQAQTISDRNQFKDYRFWTGDFWRTLLNKILLNLTGAIQEEYSSAAVCVLDDLLYYHFDKEGETDARWRTQVPVARKMLCIIDDNETLVNFCHSLQSRNSNKRDVYKNGNLVDRTDVANFFNLPDAERHVVTADMAERRAKYKAGLQADEQGIKITKKAGCVADQLEYNIFHNMIEYVLTDVTGLNEIEHNRLRKHDMDALQQLVLKNFKPQSADYYYQKLIKELDPKGAKEISDLLAELSLVLQQYIAHKAKNPYDLRTFIDNWSLHTDLIDKIKHNSYTLDIKFKAYARNHLIMGIMTGMGKFETQIAESRPFTGLNRRVQQMYDSDGTLVDAAKKRKHTSLEVLNDTSTESVFTPEYLDISEETADNYFRLGFVGMYVSNKKTEGFSDRNLHTVINLAEETLSNTNNPETQIQGIGRNRGLDPTIEPAYIHSLGRKQKTVFDLRHLERADYYPELFDAQKKYNSDFVQVLGAKVSQQIIAWVHGHLDDDETINPDRLKRQVLKFIAQALRDINNKNSHQIKLSRAQLTDIVHYAMQGLDKEIAQIEKPYRLSLFLRGLSHTLNFISECYYTIKRIPVALHIYYHSWFGTRQVQGSDNPKHPDDVYIKIIHKTNFKDIISQMSSALEFKNWMGQKAKGVVTHLKKNLPSYLSPQALDDYTMHQKQLLEPLLIQCVVGSKQKKVADALRDFPHSTAFFHSQLSALVRLFKEEGANSKKFNPGILAVLQQIPGLADLQLSDVVHYPEQAAEIGTLFTESPILTITKNPALNEAAVVRLSLFLQKDFAKSLSAFVGYPNAVLIKKLFEKDENAQLFAKHCLTRLATGMEFSAALLFTELNIFFKLSNVHLLTEDMESLQTGFAAIKKKMADNLIECLDEAVLDKIVTIVAEQLVPLLVNLYPLEARAQLFSEACDKEKIKKLLIKQGNKLSEWGALNESQLAQLLFSQLSSAAVPAPINLEQEVARSTTFVATQLERIMQTGVVNLFVGKLFAPSSWSLTPQYMYDRSIADLLQSEGFLNAISLLLPYDQWLKLKKDIAGNYATLITIARVLIDKRVSGDQSQPSPAELLTLLNTHLKTNYQSSEQVAKKAKSDLEALVKNITDNPMTHLSAALKEQIVGLGSNPLLPLLASFIKEDSKKQQLLQAVQGSTELYDFIVKNADVLMDLANQSDEQLLETPLLLINQLLPKQQLLSATDLHNPAKHAQHTAQQLTHEIMRKLLIVLLSSDLFRSALNKAFNPHDYQLLMKIWANDKQLDALATEILKAGVDTLDKDAILTYLKNQNPSLKSIVTLDARMQSFAGFMRKITENSGAHLNTHKVSTLTADSLTEVLFHKQFIKCIDNITGFLNEQDLLVLFDAMGKPKDEVKQYLRFIEIIRKHDKDALISEFMVVPEAVKDFDFDQLPAKKMLTTVTALIEEVLDCHCYYNGHDRKGSIGGGNAPRLKAKISAQLAEMTIDTDRYSFFSNFSRKGFYIHGITRGLNAGGAINADANHQMVSILQRIKGHILRPLWWSTNVSNLGHAFIKGCRDVVHGCVAGWYGALNGIKSALNWIGGTSYFKISNKHPDSVDFNDTAFDFAHTVNDLQPLAGEQVNAKECPVDVVTGLEEFVAKRPARPGFFGGNLGPAASLEVEDSSPAPKL